ncbi:unnamed protein product, partial [Coregonus sp. 'balchen']
MARGQSADPGWRTQLPSGSNWEETSTTWEHHRDSDFQLRRLRYRLDSGERRTLRLPVWSRVFSRLTSPPYDRFPKTDVSERPQGFLARLFPCL